MNRLTCLGRGHNWAQWVQGLDEPTESRVCVRCWRLQERPLIGSLCDETPGLTAGESARLGELYTQRQQAKPRAEAPETGATFYDDLNRELQDPAVATEFAANAERIQAIDASRRAEAGRWEPRHDEDATPVTEAVEREMAQLLLERDAAEQRADALAERLRQRNRMLGQFLTPAAVAELDRADRAWIGHTDTAVLPVPSRPGLAIDLTRPGDDDDLLIGRPW